MQPVSPRFSLCSQALILWGSPDLVIFSSLKTRAWPGAGPKHMNSVRQMPSLLFCLGFFNHRFALRVLQTRLRSSPAKIFHGLISAGSPRQGRPRPRRKNLTRGWAKRLQISAERQARTSTARARDEASGWRGVSRRAARLADFTANALCSGGCKRARRRGALARAGSGQAHPGFVTCILQCWETSRFSPQDLSPWYALLWYTANCLMLPKGLVGIVNKYFEALELAEFGFIILVNARAAAEVHTQRRTLASHGESTRKRLEHLGWRR